MGIKQWSGFCKESNETAFVIKTYGRSDMNKKIVYITQKIVDEESGRMMSKRYTFRNDIKGKDIYELETVDAAYVCYVARFKKMGFVEVEDKVVDKDQPTKFSLSEKRELTVKRHWRAERTAIYAGCEFE